MDQSMISLVLAAAGIYFGLRNLRLLRNPDALRAYMQSSPKAAMWVRRYGLDRATELTRQIFLPLGLAVCAVITALGLWGLWKVYG